MRREKCWRGDLRVKWKSHEKNEQQHGSSGRLSIYKDMINTYVVMIEDDTEKIERGPSISWRLAMNAGWLFGANTRSLAATRGSESND
jgi:hypothetical protein